MSPSPLSSLSAVASAKADLLSPDGESLHRLATELYPICRSITGNGLRQTLRRLQGEVPLELREVATGAQVFDWTIPKEWNVRDAWIKDADGNRVVDFQKSSLHLVNYSMPVRRRLSLEELKPHLHSLAEHPDWVPYRTSYYREAWGFCLSQRQLESMREGEYDVMIDSTLEPGHLTYGELSLPGSTEEEVLISVHCCHPSLANDNLSGMVVATALAKAMQAAAARRYSYRFLWIPGTIGSITWLARNESVLRKIRHGLVLSCVGDPGRFTYKRSRRGDAEIDRAVEHVLRTSGQPHEILDFTPLGYDERQYCSPGINLPLGCFMRTPNGRYPEYHTSADNLGLVTPQALGESMEQLLRVVRVLEGNQRYRNLSPKGEPQLGRRGLYRSMGGTASERDEEALLWVLNYSDGEQGLLDIAERSNVPFEAIETAAKRLVDCGLLRTEP